MVENHSSAYEFRVISLLFLAWGFIFLDRTALSYIIPSLIQDIDLTNGQIGSINMWQTIGYALAGPLIGFFSDKTGKRKPFLIGAMVATSIFSAISALANSYTSLLIVRFLVGASEGPILPLAMTMVVAASAPGRFGRNAGIVNAGVSVISGTLGPLLVTQLVEYTSWHLAFVIVSAPSFLLALLIWRFTTEVKPVSTNAQLYKEEKTKTNVFDLLKYRNIVLGIFISICCMAGLWILYSFSPLYLTTIGQVSISKMGVIMSSMGLVGILTAVLVPLFSDYYGRKKALILFGFLASLAPLGLFLFPGSWVGSGSFIIFGGLLGSAAPLFMSVIPSESVPMHLVATSSALIIGIGEIVGSFILGGAGIFADSFGLSFVMIVATVAAIVMSLLGFGLIETNLRRERQKPENIVDDVAKVN